jgi:hypothetical protein
MRLRKEEISSPYLLADFLLSSCLTSVYGLGFNVPAFSEGYESCLGDLSLIIG